MSQADPSPRSEHRGPSPADPTVSAEHLLPPVEPPSAGFIVQLFVIPGLIVAAIVVIWLMFSWIARSATDAQSFLTELKRNNGSRWQAALNLATALHSDRQLRRDEPFARHHGRVRQHTVERRGRRTDQPGVRRRLGARGDCRRYHLRQHRRECGPPRSPYISLRRSGRASL